MDLILRFHFYVSIVNAQSLVSYGNLKMPLYIHSELMIETIIIVSRVNDHLVSFFQDRKGHSNNILSDLFYLPHELGSNNQFIHRY